MSRKTHGVGVERESAGGIDLPTSLSFVAAFGSPFRQVRKGACSSIKRDIAS